MCYVNQLSHGIYEPHEEISCTTQLVLKSKSKFCSLEVMAGQQRNSTTNINNKRKKTKFVCPICDKAILDAVGKKSGEDAVECDGRCATWLYRRCAGLSKGAFEIVSKSNDPFFCPQCRLDKQELDIKSLRDLVIDISGQLKIVSNKLATLTQKDNVASSSSVTSYSLSVSNEADSHHYPPLTNHEPPVHKGPRVSNKIDNRARRMQFNPRG